MTYLPILFLLLMATGCVTEQAGMGKYRSATEGQMFRPGIAWNGQVDQVYFVQWTPWIFDQWVDVSGPLEFLTTNMLWIIEEQGAHRIATQCRP